VYRYYAVRGRVIDMTTDGGQESIDEISHKYLGMTVSLSSCLTCSFTGQIEDTTLAWESMARYRV
jgi:hypothetical protein